MMVGGSRFEAPRGRRPTRLDGQRVPTVSYLLDGRSHDPGKLAVVVGCDGSHGICRGRAIPTHRFVKSIRKIIPSGGWEFLPAR